MCSGVSSDDAVMIVDGVTACDGGWTHRLTLFGLFVSLLVFTLSPALLFTAHVQQAQSVARPAAYYVPMFRGVLTAGKVCNALEAPDVSLWGG